MWHLPSNQWSRCILTCSLSEEDVMPNLAWLSSSTYVQNAPISRIFHSCTFLCTFKIERLLFLTYWLIQFHKEYSECMWNIKKPILTSSVSIAQIWESPYISQSHRKSATSEQELYLLLPLLSRLKLDLFFCAQRSIAMFVEPVCRWDKRFTFSDHVSCKFTSTFKSVGLSVKTLICIRHHYCLVICVELIAR